jgi:hypothetical protein
VTLVPPSEEQDRSKESPGSTGQLFSVRATTLFRVGLCAAFLLVIGSGFVASAYYHSNYWNEIGYAPKQPVSFSHRRHAGELRIDCRNCHASVETAAFAGMPSTQTCLVCHSQVLTNTPMLLPVIESAARNMPLRWSRVTHLPDHVYFDHSIHVSKGVGCATCHGDIGKMAFTAKAEPLTMRWCLDCHRDPGPRLRRPSEVFAATSPLPQSPERQNELLRFYHIRTGNLTDCSTCHN